MSFDEHGNRRKKNGALRPSTRGSRQPVVDSSGWRRAVRADQIKFDDRRKAVYLDEVRASGLKGRAAKVAGVSRLTVANHLRDDPEFGLALDTALEEYRDSIVDEVIRRGRDGVEEPVYQKGERAMDCLYDRETGRAIIDPETNEPVRVPAVIRRYSDPLLLAEARRIEPEYRDRPSVDINTSGGGVLLAPAGMTPEEFIQHSEAFNATSDRRHLTIEGHAVDGDT